MRRRKRPRYDVRKERSVADRFEDDDEGAWERWRPCQHPDHNVPNMIYIPPGKKLVHTCPGCGFTVTVRGSQVVC